MSADSLGKVISLNGVRKRLINKQLDYQRQSKGKKIYFGNTETVHCSQCARGMKKSLADKQIQFKRNNAPICIPCIEGKPRRDIKINIAKGKHMERIKNEWRKGIHKKEKRQNLKEIEELFNR